MFFRFEKRHVVAMILTAVCMVFLFMPAILTNIPKLLPAHMFLGAEKGMERVGGWFGYAQQDEMVLPSREAELYSAYLQMQDEYLKMKEQLSAYVALREARFSELPSVMAVDVIIPWDASPWRKSVIINAGYSEGIEPDLPVVYGRNIVGRVSEAGPYSSRVQLMTDPGFHIEVELMPDYTAAPDQKVMSYSGILNGNGEGEATIEHIMRDTPVQAGWVVLTKADLRGYWRGGLIVGKVKDVSDIRGAYLKITVEPDISLTNVKSAMVLKFPRGLK